jgi:dipeptidyl aminopeptidase/acylaminoacyl peptidase
MQSRSISFFSEGVRLAGTLSVPGDLRSGERRAGIVLCHGYTGVRDLYLPDIANVLCEAGYVVLTFDYKGWGDSDGPKSRLAPYSRVIDVQSAVTWLGAQEFVDPERLGIYGTSYGGATVVWVAAVESRVKCVVSVVGVGNGQRGCAACDAQMNITICCSGRRRTECGGLWKGIRRWPREPRSCFRTGNPPNWRRRRGEAILARSARSPWSSSTTR